MDSRACATVGREASEWIPVKGGLRQWFVIMALLFYVYLDSVT